jgi:arsenate reductase
MTLRVLNEIGIQHNGRSKSAEMFRGQEFDLVVTVCDAANQECPVWLGTGRKAHLSFADPAAVSGSEEERLLAFRRVRDEIALRIPELLSAQVP